MFKLTMSLYTKFMNQFDDLYFRESEEGKKKLIPLLQKFPSYIELLDYDLKFIDDKHKDFTKCASLNTSNFDDIKKFKYVYDISFCRGDYPSQKETIPVYKIIGVLD